MKRSPMKRFVSWLAGFYSNTFFYGSELRTEFNGILDKEKSTYHGQKMSGLAQAAMMVSVAVSERMSVGDVLEAKFDGVDCRGEDKGSYEITIKRTA